MQILSQEICQNCSSLCKDWYCAALRHKIDSTEAVNGIMACGGKRHSRVLSDWQLEAVSKLLATE